MVFAEYSHVYQRKNHFEFGNSEETTIALHFLMQL